MNKSPSFPDYDDIERLGKIYQADKGFFCLSVYSLIEWYIRKFCEKNKVEDFNGNTLRAFDGWTKFCEKQGFLDYYRKYVEDRGRNFKLYQQIKDGVFEANKVRHNFENADNSKAKQASTILRLFANFANLHCKEEIYSLDKTVNAGLYGRTFSNPDEYILALIDSLINSKYSPKDLRSRIEKLIKLDDAQNELNSKIEELTKNIEKLQVKLSDSAENKKELEEKLSETKKLLKEKTLELEKTGEERDSLKDVQEQLEKTKEIATYARTRKDFEESLKLLTPQQAEIVEKASLSRNFLVKGDAGTGKTIVLLKLLEKYLDNAEEEKSDISAVFISYSKTLRKYNDYISKILEIRNIKAKLFVTSDSYLMDICNSVEEAKENKLDRKTYTFDYLSNFVSDTKVEISLGENATEEENRNYAWAFMGKITSVLENLLTENEFLARNGNTLEEWKTIQRIFTEFDKKKTQFIYYGIYKLAKKIQQEENFRLPENVCHDYLFIDEVQDLGKAKLTILNAAASKNVFMAGDNKQSVFLKKFNWNQVGIKLDSSNSKRLTVNLRNSIPISNVAQEFKNLKIEDEKSELTSFIPGPPVKLTEAETTDILIEEIAKDVRYYHDIIGIEWENICVISHLSKLGKTDYISKISAALDAELKLNKKDKASSMDIHKDEFNFLQKKVVKVSSAQNCKGIECPVVLYLADHRNHIYGDEDKDLMNRNLSYTALTRASQFLHVYMLNDISEDNESFIDLKKILKEGAV